MLPPKRRRMPAYWVVQSEPRCVCVKRCLRIKFQTALCADAVSESRRVFRPRFAFSLPPSLRTKGEGMPSEWNGYGKTYTLRRSSGPRSRLRSATGMSRTAALVRFAPEPRPFKTHLSFTKLRLSLQKIYRSRASKYLKTFVRSLSPRPHKLITIK